MTPAATSCAAEAARILALLSRPEALDLPSEIGRAAAGRRRAEQSSTAEGERWELLEAIMESLARGGRDGGACLHLLKHIAACPEQGPPGRNGL